MLANPSQSSDFAKQASNGKKACISLMLRVEIVYEEHIQDFISYAVSSFCFTLPQYVIMVLSQLV